MRVRYSAKREGQFQHAPCRNRPFPATLAPRGERGVALPPEEGAPVSKTAGRDDRLLALMVQTPDEPGMLHELTRVILEHRANITYVDIAERREDGSTIYFELEDVPQPDTLIHDLAALSIVRTVERAPRQIATTFAASASRSIRSRWSARRTWRGPCGRLPAYRGRWRWSWRVRSWG